MLYTFVGTKGRNPRSFKTDEGVFIYFDKEISLYDDCMYVILCSRNKESGLFTLLSCHYWWENKTNKLNSNIFY